MIGCVIEFLGSNCIAETVSFFSAFGKVDKVFYTDDISSKNYDFIVIPGGFSYGDYLRSGAIASRSGIFADIKSAASSGKKVIGICNGFQILTESGILPGALTHNIDGHFICKNSVLKCEGVFEDYEYTTMQIAHHEGRYVASDDEIKSLQDRGQIAFRYSDNPNGSLENIAGITGGVSNNVLGMMPHPERPILIGSQMFNSESIIKSFLNS